jgi:hypothetical protein
MLGFSFEPLMQIIAAYRPQEVLLVINARYDVVEGEEFKETRGGAFYERNFKHAFDLLVRHNLLDRKPIIHPAPISTLEGVKDDDDEPVMVFRFLRRHLLPLMRGPDGRSRRAVVDITGAKKSMVAGAYLFAAFADVPVSYVDFDYYDTEKGRPYGFTCKIGEMQSPTRKFRLREWERVRELYRRYAFRGAAELLDEKILPAMQGYFEEDEIAAARKMVEVLGMYELWDNGDHSRAFEKATDIFGAGGEEMGLLPTAIPVLGRGGYWPHGDDIGPLLGRLKEIEETGAGGHPILYLDMSRLTVYARDELDKIKRLIEENEDYRSALLRAVGLTEVLIRARLLVLLERGKVQVSNSTAPDSFVDWEAADEDIRRWRAAMQRRIITEVDIYRKLLPALRYRTDAGSRKAERCATLVCIEGEEERTFHLRRKESDSPLIPSEALLRRENELRNKAIHTYLSLPFVIADKALEIARRSTDDFVENWAVMMYKGESGLPTKVCTKHMAWQKLCGACGVNFLPPREEENT